MKQFAGNCTLMSGAKMIVCKLLIIPQTSANDPARRRLIAELPARVVIDKVYIASPPVSIESVTAPSSAYGGICLRTMILSVSSGNPSTLSKNGPQNESFRTSSGLFPDTAGAFLK